MFKNRQEAGHLLAKALREKGWKFDIVLGIPRGGVIIAREIARQFNCPLDVILAKKIGSPSLPEYAVGAVTPDGEILVHERLNHLWEEQKDAIKRMAQSVQKEINRQLDLFRSQRKAIHLEGLRILLVDDGIVTGFTVKAAILYLKRQGVSEIRIAVPLCSQNAYPALNKAADDILALYIPQRMYAVSQFYEDFSSVEDGEIIEGIYCNYSSLRTK
ncbi:MAG: phosphoribosyltransferase [Syntrophomonadaceae bacterium]|nr:phosphoribosyltransferase [Syntrophomonadaceae bacterium]